MVEPPTQSRQTADGKVSNVVPARYAMAWFGHPNRDAVIRPLEECCTVDKPQLYKPVIAGKHVKERMARLLEEGYLPEKWTDDMHRKVAAAPAVAV